MEKSISKECRAVANYLIENINRFNEGKELRNQVMLTTKRLQKLLFLCDIKFMLDNDGTYLFSDDYYIWPSGPVIPSFYNAYFQYQDGPMKAIYDDVVVLSDLQKQVIDFILEFTCSLDTSVLIQITTASDKLKCHNIESINQEEPKMVSKREIYGIFLENNPFSMHNSTFDGCSKKLLKTTLKK